MRTIGLIGGMSWESTTLYYQWINREVKCRLGGLHSAKLILISVDFAEIEAKQHAGDWAGTAEILVDAALRLEAADADCLVICTNTMHKVAPQIEAASRLPLIHIADATAKEIQRNRYEKVGLLGTGFTMTQDFYKQRITEVSGKEVLIPDHEEKGIVHNIIYQELCRGLVQSESRNQYLNIIQGLKERGAEAIILGCTEITLLVNPSDTDIPLLDTTAIHARAAADFALTGCPAH